jgi:hypothetical protein
MRLSCKEVTHLVSEGYDRHLGAWERVRLRLHLMICDGCTNFTKQLAFLRNAVRLLESKEP